MTAPVTIYCVVADKSVQNIRVHIADFIKNKFTLDRKRTQCNIWAQLGNPVHPTNNFAQWVNSTLGLFTFHRKPLFALFSFANFLWRSSFDKQGVLIKRTFNHLLTNLQFWIYMYLQLTLLLLFLTHPLFSCVPTGYQFRIQDIVGYPIL